MRKDVAKVAQEIQNGTGRNPSLPEKNDIDQSGSADAHFSPEGEKCWLEPGDQQFSLEAQRHRQRIVKLDEKFVLRNDFLFPIFDIDAKCFFQL